MFDLENIEDINQGANLENPGLSQSEIDYLCEILPTNDSELIASRVDEIQGINELPAKAIDNDPQIAEILSPVRDTINPLYLEAPNDYEQAGMIGNAMTDIEGINYETWSSLSIEDKLGVLQEIENKAAEVAHRPICSVSAETLDRDENGHYITRCHPEFITDEELKKNPEIITQALQEIPQIVINSDLLNGSYAGYRDALDTVLHEGRHAYQEYNLYGREVHSSSGDLTNWKLNEFDYKYQDASEVGYKLYCLQPLETDARKFAEDVLAAFDNHAFGQTFNNVDTSTSASEDITAKQSNILDALVVGSGKMADISGKVAEIAANMAVTVSNGLDAYENVKNVFGPNEK